MDEFTEVTAPGLEEGGGARQGKAIIILLPMEPMITGTTIFDPAERAAWLLSRGGGVLLAQRRHRSRTTVTLGHKSAGSDARARRLLFGRAPSGDRI
jgi:hypothetical protein